MTENYFQPLLIFYTLKPLPKASFLTFQVRYFLMKFKMQRHFKNNAHIKRIKHYLTNCSIGDWYVLYQMSKNLNQRFFAEYLTVLAMTIGLSMSIYLNFYLHFIQRILSKGFYSKHFIQRILSKGFYPNCTLAVYQSFTYPDLKLIFSNN